MDFVPELHNSTCNLAHAQTRRTTGSPGSPLISAAKTANLKCCCWHCHRLSECTFEVMWHCCDGWYRV